MGTLQRKWHHNSNFLDKISRTVTVLIPIAVSLNIFILVSTRLYRSGPYGVEIGKSIYLTYAKSWLTPTLTWKTPKKIQNVPVPFSIQIFVHMTLTMHRKTNLQIKMHICKHTHNCRYIHEYVGLYTNILKTEILNQYYKGPKNVILSPLVSFINYGHFLQI